MGKIIGALLLLLSVIKLSAQEPTNVVAERQQGLAQPGLRAACNNKAGTIKLGSLIGKSNTPTSSSVIYLCFKDSFSVTHNQDFDLSSDPVPATPAGIGYVFFNCKPSLNITGPTLKDILKDTCINRSSILLNGTPTPPNLGFWIARGDRIGNIGISNRGVLQNLYNGGKPISFFFAPITIDRFNNASNLPAYEETAPGAGIGNCVNLNPTQAFQVVYLNEIVASSIKNNIDAIGCQGSFVLKGGLPEFETNSKYKIDIALASNSSIKGTVTKGNLGNGDTVRFFVPQPGIYNITVNDGKSCGTTFTVDMAGCDATSFRLPFINARPGDAVCVDLTVKDFKQIAALELRITWDSKVVQFTNVSKINSALTGLTFGTQISLNPSKDTMRVAWTDPNFKGVSLPDSAVLFQICYSVIGRLGQNSPLKFLQPRQPNETIGDPNTVPYGYIFNNGQINISDQVLFVGVKTDSIRCNGDKTGAITITAASALPPYQITWRALSPLPTASGFGDILSSGASFKIPNLLAGSYAIRVQDASNPINFYNDTIEVIQPPSLAIRLVPLRDPSCFGASDGSLKAEILINAVALSSLDTAKLKLVWSVPGKRGKLQIDSLKAGPYSATITDAVGCINTASSNLANPSEITLNSIINQPACSGLSNGQISVTASGGTSANGRYKFNWDNKKDTTASTSVIRNLQPGKYCVTITDDKGCSVERCFQLTALKTLSIDPATKDITCFNGKNGEIVAAGSTDGAPPLLPYTFTWKGNLSTPAVATNTNSTIRNLTAGTYIVTMRDNDPRGCLVTDTISLTQPSVLRLIVVESKNESCRVGGDGLIRVSASGGTPAYTYNWSNGQRDSVITNLVKGNYTLTLTDKNGCDTTLVIPVTSPASPKIDALADFKLNCSNDKNGVLTVSASPNGSPIATYQWSNNISGKQIINLAPGSYIVTVTADDGCKTVDTALVIAPTAVKIDSVIAKSPICPGEKNGQLRVVATGGTSPYRYVWQASPKNDTTILSTRIALAAGNYDITVVDANKCPAATTTARVDDPPRIAVFFLDSTAIRCVGECNGGATATARYSNGKSGRFTFTWPSGEKSTNVATSSATKLCGKFQILAVQDSNACVSSARVSVPSPDSILIKPKATQVVCNGQANGSIAANVSGGSKPYVYLWVGNGGAMDTLRNLGVGTYTLRVTDARGCSAEKATDVTQPDPLVISINQGFSRNATCSNTTDGKITVQVNTQDKINPLGASPFTWSGGISSPSSLFAEKLAPGRYYVTVTDSKGCTDSASYTVLSPPPVVAVIRQPAEPKCFGETTLIRVDTAYGGNGTSIRDYTFTLNNNGLSEPITRAVPSFAGRIIVKVEDQAKCSFLDTLTVNQPVQLLAEFVPDKVTVELGDSTITLNPKITSSLPVSSYLYNPPKFLSDSKIKNPIVRPEDDQEYILTVVDANGCTTQAKVFVELDRNRNVYIPNAFTPDGDGINDEFRVFACKGVRRVNSAQVFDRWGNKVFDNGTGTGIAPDCNGGTILWDGTQGGNRLNQGVYVYVVEVEFLDNIKLVYRGDIKIIR
jgi:gliding motility-associated-like protein